MIPTTDWGDLRRFFAGLTEFTFEARVGIADPTLVDYVTELLTRFSHYDEIYRVKNLYGRRLDQVSDMLLEAETRPAPLNREVHRHIGDFTLFWSGLYPEALRWMQAAPRKDAVLNYKELGKRAYRIASTIPPADNPEENTVLERLSHDYELCLYGLNELRREWERRDDAPPALPPLG
ncbi:MAG: hypothetical protein SFX18_17040 [Pirellulales bacterium]|nr:hypothetical protein [Pirellulales bacterium]